MDEFFVKVDGEEKGPFTFEELTDGRLEPNDLVRTETNKWEKAADIIDFADYFRYEGYYFPTEANLAGFGIRLMAYLIDYIAMVILMMIGIATYVTIQLPGADMNEFILKNQEIMRTVIAPAFLVSYFIITGILPMSASVGQYACKLIIVNADGKKINAGQAILRGAFKFLSGAFFGVGFISILISKYKQGFHDVFARTYVVRKELYYPETEEQQWGSGL